MSASRRIRRWVSVVFIGAFFAHFVWAETLELVTYYPTQMNIETLDTLNVLDTLGIGTDSPETLFHLVGPASENAEALFMPGAEGGLFVGIGVANPASDTRAPLQIGGRDATGVRINVDSLGTGDSALVLRDLDTGVAADNNRALVGRLDGTHTWGAGLLMTNVVNNSVVGRYMISGTGEHLFGGAGSDVVDAPNMVITPEGLVGIGTDDPQAGLHVVGGLYVLGGDGDADGNGSLTTLDMLAIMTHLNDPQGRPFTPEQRVRADVTGDGIVNVADLKAIESVIAARGSGPPMTEAEREAAKQRDPLWRTLYADENRNLGIITVNPMDNIPLPPNNARMGNINANDVYLRSVGQWASQAGGGALKRFASFKVTFHTKGNSDAEIILDLSDPSAITTVSSTRASLGAHHRTEPFLSNSRAIYCGWGLVKLNVKVKYWNVNVMPEVQILNNGSDFNPGQIKIRMRGNTNLDNAQKNNAVIVRVTAFQFV